MALRNFIEYRGECRDIQLRLKLDGYAEVARRASLIDDQRSYQPARDSEPPAPNEP